MKITVNAKAFTKIFRDFVKNRKVMMNFKITGDILNIELMEEYTVCYPIKVKVDSVDQYTEISTFVDKTINVLTEDEDVVITIAESVINISQGAFYTTLVKEYEARREFVDTTSLELKNAYANRLKYLTHCAVSCMGMAKELGFSDPDPVFTCGKFYMDYQQAFLVEHMEYPECCVTLSILRDFVYKLDDNAVFAHLPDLSMLYFRTQFYEFWVPTVNYNIDGNTIAAVNKKMAELVPVTKIKLTDYAQRLQILTSAFPKKQFTIAIGEGEFNVSITSNTTYATVGNSISKYLLSKHITSAQLDTVLKLFKDDEEVEILRGGNCLCLQSGEKSMLIAGMIF